MAPARMLGDLRGEVRAFLAAERAAGGFAPHCDSWLSGHDPAFSRKLARRGWLGMTVPREYGGHGRSFTERYAVIEELLAAGAPVAAHWFADRQTGPLLLRYGTEDQRRRFLPGIAAGETFFAIGLSEPDSGSDLASIRTAASRTEGGYLVSGAKVWTSHAHRSQFATVLVRTSPPGPDGRHAGLSQFIVALDSPGVTVRPIRILSGHAHFNEVLFDGVFVPDDMLVGEEGAGWHQVTSELAYERSGPERFMSTYPLLAETVHVLGPAPGPVAARTLGRLVAWLKGLRAMSMALAERLEKGESPAVEAAMVKDLGTRFELEIIEAARQLVEPLSQPDGSTWRRLLDEAVTHAPGFTLRGGTNEILRGIIAKAAAR